MTDPVQEAPPQTPTVVSTTPAPETPVVSRLVELTKKIKAGAAARTAVDFEAEGFKKPRGRPPKFLTQGSKYFQPVLPDGTLGMLNGPREQWSALSTAWQEYQKYVEGAAGGAIRPPGYKEYKRRPSKSAKLDGSLPSTGSSSSSTAMSDGSGFTPTLGVISANSVIMPGSTAALSVRQGMQINGTSGGTDLSSASGKTGKAGKTGVGRGNAGVQILSLTGAHSKPVARKAGEKLTGDVPGLGGDGSIGTGLTGATMRGVGSGVDSAWVINSAPPVKLAGDGGPGDVGAASNPWSIVPEAPGEVPVLRTNDNKIIVPHPGVTKGTTTSTSYDIIKNHFDIADGLPSADPEIIAPDWIKCPVCGKVVSIAVLPATQEGRDSAATGKTKREELAEYRAAKGKSKVVKAKEAKEALAKTAGAFHLRRCAGAQVYQEFMDKGWHRATMGDLPRGVLAADDTQDKLETMAHGGPLGREQTNAARARLAAGSISDILQPVFGDLEGAAASVPTGPTSEGQKLIAELTALRDEVEGSAHSHIRFLEMEEEVWDYHAEYPGLAKAEDMSTTAAVSGIVNDILSAPRSGGGAVLLGKRDAGEALAAETDDSTEGEIKRMRWITL